MSEKPYIPLWLKVCPKDDESLMIEWTYQLKKAIVQDRNERVPVMTIYETCGKVVPVVLPDLLPAKLEQLVEKQWIPIWKQRWAWDEPNQSLVCYVDEVNSIDPQAAVDAVLDELKALEELKE